jgi:fructose-specific phosphotransferase system IIC component
LITVIGYHIPFLIASSILLAIGCRLISAHDVNTPFAKWFGYQLVAGLGSGMSIHVSLLAVQAALDIEDVPIGTAASSPRWG